MHFWGEKALLCLLLAGWVTAMPQDMMPESNQSTMGFPHMTPEFKEMAKKLMLKCSKMGYQPPAMPEAPYMYWTAEAPYNSSVDEEEMLPRNPFSFFPSLLSSLPPSPPPPPPVFTFLRLAHLSNHSVDLPDKNAEWNVTEQLWNVTSLPDMINIMKNSTDQPRCFMQAFISPVAWFAVTRGGRRLMPEHLEKLLWAAKPFLENMPPHNIPLPPHLDQPRLATMMRMFSEVFGSLSEEQRDQIRNWVKARVLENDFRCTPNNTRPKPLLSESMEASQPGLLVPYPSMNPEDGPKMEGEKGQIGGEADTEKEKENYSGGKKESERGREGKEEMSSGDGEEIERVKEGGRKKEDSQGKGGRVGDEEKKEAETRGERGDEETMTTPQVRPGEPGRDAAKKRMGMSSSKKGRGKGSDNLREKIIEKKKYEKQRWESDVWSKAAGRDSGMGERGRDEESNEETEGGGERLEDEEKERRGPEEEDGERGLRLVHCPPRQPWLNRRVLRIMGRFLSRLPQEEVNAIPSEELCEFYRSPDFARSFQKVGVIKASLGRSLLGRLRRECSSSQQDFLQHTASMGSLACFFDGEASSLDERMSKGLLSQLGECQNSASSKLKQQLVRKLFSWADSSPGPELLESLGSAVSVLLPSELTSFSPQALADTLPSLSKAPWSAAQATTLVKALMKKSQSISSEDLLSLGTVVRGVASSMLKNIRVTELLRGEDRERLETISRKMSALQRKALLQGMRNDVNVSELVRNVPATLLSSLSLSTLQRAQLTSMEQLQGRSWTRAQSAFLLKKILGQKVKPQQLRKMGRAIQGVTCGMIDSFSQNETVESVEALSQSSGWLAKAQISCAARKLFATLEQQREGYFSNLTEAELNSIPAVMLIHLPARRIVGLPASVCEAFLEKMKAVNLSCLPHSAPSRSALTQRALDCLGKNMSDLSDEEVLSLGPLLCELGPAQLLSLAPEVLNRTLRALASCPYIRRSRRAQIFKMVRDTFGEPSNWLEEDMQSLRPFLLLDDSALRTLPNKPWLRSSLSDLMDSLRDQSSAPVPEEFRPRPDLSMLRWKLFVLATRGDRQSVTPAQRRRRREAVAVGEPTADLIEQLGEDNVFWSPAQLSNMSSQNFTESASRLGEIRDYTAEQLASLRQKVIESWGSVEQLNESQVVDLGCLSQGFSAEELQQLNITSLDTLELLSTCRWTQTQRRAVWRGFSERSGVSAAQLGELEVVGLGQFICGLQPEEAQQLSTDGFREAAEAVGCAPCEMPQMESFKRKAVAAFGEPQSWSEGQVMALGNIMAGLDAAELQSLNSSIFSFITPSAIPLIPPQHLAALSVSQLRALGPDNAAMVTEAQQAELGEEQRKGLAETVGVAYTRSEEPSSGGSPSGAGGQEGSSLPQSGGATRITMVLLKPLLFLLLGFVLTF